MRMAAPNVAGRCALDTDACDPRDARRDATLARQRRHRGDCPTTEANLGDGLFPLRDYLDADGAWGIGSDSHISVSPVEELRWLEYGQRLISRHRNIAVSDDSSSVGETVARRARQRRPVHRPGRGRRFVVLDSDGADFCRCEGRRRNRSLDIQRQPQRDT